MAGPPNVTGRFHAGAAAAGAAAMAALDAADAGSGAAGSGGFGRDSTFAVSWGAAAGTGLEVTKAVGATTCSAVEPLPSTL